MAANNNNDGENMNRAQGVQLHSPLSILENLDDLIVNEGESALFECKVDGHPDPIAIWYKDGEVLVPTARITIYAERKWRRILIDTVILDDHGVYTVVFNNGTNSDFSSATLYVAPPQGRTAVMYTNPCIRGALNLLKSLYNMTVSIGGPVDLEVEFNFPAVTPISWFKSNKYITASERIRISRTEMSSKLFIESAALDDTGVYVAVSKSCNGIASSIAKVEVVDVDLTKYNINMPTIQEYMPDEAETNEDEELRLACKALYDHNVEIKWFRSGSMMDYDKRILEEYGGGYVALRITNVEREDAGEYSVELLNRISGQSDFSSCYVTVNPRSTDMILPLVLLKKPLVSAISCFGASVTFDCCFDLADTKYYFVVWYIGHLRVQWSSSCFDVVCANGKYLLRISSLEPCMAGEVVCELRRSFPKQKSILVSHSTCNLALVPPQIIYSEMDISTFALSRVPAIRRLTMNGDEIPLRNYKFEPLNNILCYGESDGNSTPNHILMEMSYCKLQDEFYCYLNVSIKATAMNEASVSVREKEPVSSGLAQCKTYILEWSDPIFFQTWYAIDLLQFGGYFEAGVCSSPSFEIQNPPVGKIIDIRVRSTKPVKGVTDANIVITPSNSLQLSHTMGCGKARMMRPMEEFEKDFINTTVVIGTGAFGSVMLVKDQGGELYAAKFLKTKPKKRRIYAQREYEILKDLDHPRVVNLVDAFMGDDLVVLVMDYLWGGELFERIVEQEQIREVDVVPYVRQICEGLQYLHSRNIVHLDLKPENIICVNPNTNQIKIVDFGLARVIVKGQTTKAIYGTKDYVAPEILNYEGVSLACDMWSMGVVTYMLVSGVLPFNGKTWPERSNNIALANYNYTDRAFRDVSDYAKDFIDNLLRLNPANRLTASLALEHRWLVDGPPHGAQAKHMRRLKENLLSYLATHKCRWQRAGRVMIAAHRLRIQGRNRASRQLAASGT